jgi:serine/threonine protein kinase
VLYLADLINRAMLLEDSMAGLEGARLGAYELIERVGSGGMADVYRAKPSGAGREVAAKIIRRGFSEDPLFRQRFLREAQAIAQLSHPHISPLIDFGEEQDIFYLMMPYFSGGTLRSLMERVQGPLSVKDSVEILGQLCEAVQYAHGQRIVNRNIKPQHVLIQAGKQLLLTDFGIARDTSDKRLMLPGTVEYMAPEQAMGKSDPRSDVYSLGVLLFQMLSGRVPFSGSTPAETLHKQANEPPPSIRKLNPALPADAERLLNRALAKDPRDRFQSADELFQAAQRLLQAPAQAGAEVETRAASPTERPAAPRSTPTPSPIGFGGPASSGGFLRPGGSGSSFPTPTASGRSEAGFAANASIRTPSPRPPGREDRPVTPPPMRGGSREVSPFATEEPAPRRSRSSPSHEGFAGAPAGRSSYRAAGTEPGKPGGAPPKRGGRKWLLYVVVLLLVVALGVVGVASAQLFRSKPISGTGTHTAGPSPTATASTAALKSFAYGFLRNYQVFAATKGKDAKQLTNIPEVGQPNSTLPLGINFDYLASPLVFSPDGRYIACLIQVVDAPRDGFLGGNLYVVDTTTGTVATPNDITDNKLLFSQGGDNALAWEDAHTLLIAGHISPTSLLVYDASNGNLAPAFSPSPADAKVGSILVRGQVAFYTALMPSGDTGTLVLHRYDLNSHADTTLFTLGTVPLVLGPGFASNGYAPFDISSDGTHILLRGANGNSTDGIWYGNVDGSGAQQLFSGVSLGTAGLSEAAPRLSPDGKKVLLRTDQAVYTSNLDGSKLQKYAQNGQPDWLPDSSGITIAVNTGGPQNAGPYKAFQCDMTNGSCAVLLDNALAFYWA